MPYRSRKRSYKAKAKKAYRPRKPSRRPKRSRRVAYSRGPLLPLGRYRTIAHRPSRAFQQPLSTMPSFLVPGNAPSSIANGAVNPYNLAAVLKNLNSHKY